jgi:hypothetical protein
MSCSSAYDLRHSVFHRNFHHYQDCLLLYNLSICIGVINLIIFLRFSLFYILEREPSKITGKVIPFFLSFIPFLPLSPPFPCAQPLPGLATAEHSLGLTLGVFPECDRNFLLIICRLVFVMRVGEIINTKGAEKSLAL